MKSNFSILLLSLFISGCSLFGSDEEPAEVQFTVQNFSTDELSITTAGSKTNLSISKNDFSNNEGGELPGSTSAYSSENKGTMTVSFSFLNETSELSGGEFELELREDWRWGVNFQIGPADYDPLETCLGCQFYESFELNQEALSNTESEADSLYVIVGGNYISQPVVY